MSNDQIKARRERVIFTQFAERSELPIDLASIESRAPREPGRTASPDDLIIATIEDLINAHGRGPFRRVWLLGDDCCEVAAEELSALPG